jgi:hypothetical protein
MICDYCEKSSSSLKPTVCIGPIWTKHGGQPLACEECYEHLKQRDEGLARFKKRFVWALWIIACLIAGWIWNRW